MAPDEVVLSEGLVLTKDQLLEALRAQAAPPGRVAASVRADAGLAGVFAVAWRCVVYQQVRALLVLTDAGMLDAGLLNARVVLEHAAYLACLRAAAVEGTDAVFLQRLEAGAGEEQRRTIKALLEVAQSAGDPSVAAVREAERFLAQHRSGGGGEPPMAGYSVMRVVYRQLSDTAHAGIGSADPYLREFLRTGSLGRSPTPVRWAEALAHLVWSCWCADQTVDYFLVDGATADRHQPVLDRLGLCFTLQGPGPAAGVAPGSARQTPAGRLHHGASFETPDQQGQE